MRAFSLLDLSVMGVLAVGFALAPVGGCGGTTEDIGDAGSGTDAATTDHTVDHGGLLDASQDGPNLRDTTTNDVVEPDEGMEDASDAEPDATGSMTIGCPTTPCEGGLGCCARLTGADAGFACEAKCTDTVDCLKPSDCADSGTPVCCATAVVDDPTGTFPECFLASGTIKSVKTACQTATACPSDFMPSCDATDVLRACSMKSDCTESAYPDCCGLPVDGTTVYACIPSEYAPFLTCTM